MSLEMCQEHAGLSSSDSQEGLIARPQSPLPIFESSIYMQLHDHMYLLPACSSMV